jgi:hypothetical protein
LRREKIWKHPATDEWSRLLNEMLRIVAMHRLNTASLFSVKWSLTALLVFMWLLTLQGLLTHNSRVIPFCYILPPFTVLIPWWLSGFKQVTLSGHSLIVRDSEKEAHIPVETVKRVSEHPWGRGFAHVTVIFNSDTQFGRRVRIKTYWSDCEHVASLIKKAMEARK